MSVVPSHRIHTIYTTYGPGLTPSTPLSAAQASSFAHLPNVSVTSHRARAVNFSILAARTAAASAAASSSSHSALRVLDPHPRSSRRAPPPPPPPTHQRSQRTAYITDDNPFADGPLELVVPTPRTTLSPTNPAGLIASRTRISSCEPSSSSASAETVTVPPGIRTHTESVTFDPRLVRGRLVASVLLSRGHGRPMRRRPGGAGEGRAYVKSRLSKTIALEA